MRKIFGWTFISLPFAAVLSLPLIQAGVQKGLMVDAALVASTFVVVACIIAGVELITKK